MITKWSIENFKSFRNKTDIELAPITVFAGANSSGKSTIIQSILLMKQTVQYAPPTRALALNGPMLKLGKFSDVKNAASDQDFIGIGWEIELADSDRLLFRNAIGTAFQPSRLWGRTSVSQVAGSFSWEVPADTEIGPGGLGTPEALLQLQPKLATSFLRVSGSDDPSEKNRFIKLRRREAESEIGDDSGFAFIVPEVDTASSQEMLAAKPDGQIVGAGPRHFFPGQVLVKFDGAMEKAFRVAIALCAEDMYRYRSPNLLNVKVPYAVVQLFQQKVPTNLGKNVGGALMRVPSDELITVEHLSDLLIHAMASVEAHRARTGQQAKFNFLDIRPLVTNLLFEYFKDQDDVQRDAVEPQIPRLIYEGAEQATAYFIAAVRYLGPLRDEPRPIYPLEALANPTEVGYKGEHTAAVLELHRDRRIRYLPSNFLEAKGDRRLRLATLHDAVVDWLQYVGVASEIRTSDSGKFGHEIQVQTPGVPQFHDLTNVGVGVSQVLPIIVMALLAEPPTLLIFEQPELHLHPKVQARLADFFLSVALSGKQCLLETHSEYLVERFRLRIAQAEGDSMTRIVKLYFTERKEGDTSCRPVAVTKYGAVPEWPRDFFDQSQIEAEQIIQAARAKRRREKDSAGDQE